MQLDRCPACAAAVRKDAVWCTLCYADLRPAPPPPAPVASVAAVHAPAVSDSLDAPYEQVLASVYAGAPATQLPSSGTSAPDRTPVGWPCNACGELNSFEVEACAVCSAAFGGLLQTKTPEFDRKRLTLIALAVVGAFLLVVAALVFVTTKAPKGGGTSSRVEQVGPDGGPGQSGQTGPQAPAGEIANL